MKNTFLPLTLLLGACVGDVDADAAVRAWASAMRYTVVAFDCSGRSAVSRSCSLRVSEVQAPISLVCVKDGEAVRCRMAGG